MRRRLAAIRKLHRLFRLPSPADEEVVFIAVRRAGRAKAARPHQALGLNQDLRNRLLHACPATLIGKRDRALIALGYDTLCRRAELVGLRVEDFTPAVGGGKGATILIRRAKNDPFGSGRLGYVSQRTTEMIADWVGAGAITKGPLFCRVHVSRSGQEGLHPFTANRILWKTAKRAALPDHFVRGLSGHSMRVGAAQDMMLSGFDLLPIMHAGGWKSTEVIGR